MRITSFVFLLATLSLHAADPRVAGTLLFQDDFNRSDGGTDKEDIGGGWTSNRGWRAKGHKQVTVADGAMSVTKHAEADHGGVIEVQPKPLE